MLLSVIIVSYNTKELTVETVQSIISSTKNSKLLKDNLEIIVVDNNSSDNSVTALKSLKKELSVPLHIIENKQNVGFGNANNEGIKKATGTYYLFLNSDTIVKEMALENMVQRFLHSEKDESAEKKLGILTPVLLNIDLTYQPQGGSLPSLTSLFFHMTMLDDLPVIGKLFPSTQHTGKTNRLTLELLAHYTELISVDWVGGTAMMISRKAIDTIGPFDQNIFMYGEDTEICIRAKNHNFLVALDPTAHIIHLQNKSSSQENAIRGEYKGYQYIFAKHTNATQAVLAKILLQYGALLRIFVFSFISVNKNKVAVYKRVLKDLS
ncbi:glycosyltransferase family 2 protein [Candidatus Woesebacteria bacterium]|nr:glycosyltransferase family 2 protein [Candidatus Woesebacteria bacterium]